MSNARAGCAIGAATLGLGAMLGAYGVATNTAAGVSGLLLVAALLLLFVCGIVAYVALVRD